jgi:hypothetical protein
VGLADEPRVLRITALDAIGPRMISPLGPFLEVISEANKPGQIQLTRIFMLMCQGVDQADAIWTDGCSRPASIEDRCIAPA